MASVDATPIDADQAWNEAHDRLVAYLRAFQISDHAHVSRVALDLLQQARALPPSDAAPAALATEQARRSLADWFAANLGEESKSPSLTLPTGYLALLLSQVYRTAPRSFLANPLPEELRQALRETLVVAGPDINISSMTPRHLDFGPMLEIARQTWHRFSAKEVIVALIFWASVYTFFYWWLSQFL